MPKLSKSYKEAIALLPVGNKAFFFCLLLLVINTFLEYFELMFYVHMTVVLNDFVTLKQSCRCSITVFFCLLLCLYIAAVWFTSFRVYWQSSWWKSYSYYN